MPRLGRQILGPEREDVLHSRLEILRYLNRLLEAGSGEFAAATSVQSHMFQSLGHCAPVGGAEGNIDFFSRYMGSRAWGKVPIALEASISITVIAWLIFWANRSVRTRLPASQRAPLLISKSLGLHLCSCIKERKSTTAPRVHSNE
jgi:hypothetical protein